MSKMMGTLLLAVAAGGAVYAQGTASGTLTIDKDTFEMKNSAAALVVDTSDKGKTKTRIVLTDKPIPADVIVDEAEVWGLKDQGFHGLQIDIAEDKQNYSLFVISSSFQGTFNMSGTFHPERLTVFTKQRVEGALEAAGEKAGETTVGYKVKFAADVAPVEAAPTPADAKAAAGKGSAKAYLAWVAAIRAGEKQKILELAPVDKRAMIDTPQFPEMLKMIQMMLSQNIEVLKATETGDNAKLLVRGMDNGKPQRGRIFMSRIDGKWVMAKESWARE